MSTKFESINIRVESTLKDKLIKLAEKDDRSLSNLIKIILTKYISSKSHD